jgi:Arc/MetJ-type ribon-helix-helix transcriptional regulator
MNKTVKIAISMSEAAFKEIETLRRKSGKNRSQVVREAVQTLIAASHRKPTIHEERAAYGTPEPGAMIDPEERKRRAIAAAGRFHSGVTDLAANHGRYLEESYAGLSHKKHADEQD